MLTLGKRESLISQIYVPISRNRKTEQSKLKATRGKEIIKFRAESNDIENRKTTEKTNKTKS